MASYFVVACWILWQIAFMAGYQDAVIDYKRQGYNFKTVRRAFSDN
jgi:hypothetical protein